MTTPITQENLYQILPLKIGRLASWLCEADKIDVAEALSRIYHSKLYKKLSDANTDYWHLGAVDLYNELKERT